MRFQCWINKATNTHSEYVILIAFPRKQWLRERASVLGHKYNDCTCLTSCCNDDRTEQGLTFYLETSSEHRRTNTTDHEEHTERNESLSVNFLSTSQGRVFRVMTGEGYRLHVREWQFDSRQEQGIYSFFKTCRSDLGPPQRPIQ